MIWNTAEILYRASEFMQITILRVSLQNDQVLVDKNLLGWITQQDESEETANIPLQVSIGLKSNYGRLDQS